MRSVVIRWLLLVMLVPVLLVVTQAEQPSPAQDPAPAPAAGQSQAPEGDTQAEEPQPEIPTFRTGINFIRVDVIVTDDDGAHVTDLQATDFEIYEDEELQEVESFELIEVSRVPDVDAEPPRQITTRSDVEREAGRTDTRVFVIFFDDYHVRWENGVRAGQQLAEHHVPADAARRCASHAEPPGDHRGR